LTALNALICAEVLLTNLSEPRSLLSVAWCDVTRKSKPLHASGWYAHSAQCFHF